MPNHWEETTWGDAVELKYGKAIRGYQDANEAYPVFGTNGQIGTHSEFLAEGPGVILGRKGAYRGVHYSKQPFFVIDTAYYVAPKQELDMHWLYYAMQHYKLGQIDDGSPIPSTTRAAVYISEFARPPIHEQRDIADCLGSFDDKIELNRRMNATLEEMARAFFRDWFVDFGPTRRQMQGATDPAAIMGHAFPPEKAATLAPLFPAKMGAGELPEGWEMRPVSDFGKLKGGKQLPKTEFVESGPFPVFGGAGHMGQTDKFNAEGYVITVGRVGAYCGNFVAHRGKAWVNNNASVFQLASFHQPEWFFLALRELDLEPIKKGAAQPFVSNGDINELPLVEPGTEARQTSNRVLSTLLKKVKANQRENQTLAALRDLLLPKLMSGEIRLKGGEVVQFSKVSKPTPDIATDLLGDQFFSPEQEEERDAVIVAATVKALQNDDLLVGNVRVMKGVYLLKRKQALSLAKFQREAAGPYDQALNHEIRGYARERSWIRETKKINRQGRRISGNQPASKFSEVKPLIMKYDLGDAVDWLAQNFKGASKEWMECVATVDVAVQELTRKGLDVTVANIKADIASDPEWKPKLSKPHFADIKIRRAVKRLTEIF